MCSRMVGSGHKMSLAKSLQTPYLGTKDFKHTALYKTYFRALKLAVTNSTTSFSKLHLHQFLS